jgi:hypothetical protein
MTAVLAPRMQALQGSVLPLAVFVLALAHATPGWAGDESASPSSQVAPAQAQTPPVETPNVRRPHRTSTHKPGEMIDVNVRKLTRALELTPDQQVKVREILTEQARQIVQLRKENAESGSDQVAANMALLGRTKARIRSVLTEEQKQKYITDVPSEQTAPAQADLQHWMDVQEANRRAGGSESK